jgi:hypothetical protein
MDRGSERGVDIRMPGHEAWVGVDPSICLYVCTLEIEIHNFDVLQDARRLEHKEELAKSASANSATVRHEGRR